VHPILIDLGFYALPTYGAILAVGVIISLLTAKRRGESIGLDGARLVDFALWLVIWALVGSKALLVILDLGRYIRSPAELLGVVRAGGVFLGGFLGALVAAAVLVRRYELPALAAFDTLSPSLALGHSIGRIGCLMAGCCWGSRCNLPWAITYTDPKAAETVGTPLHVPLHPFPIYAALFNFALYLGLAALFRRRPAPGVVFATYMVCYGAGRFALELTRGDASRGFIAFLSTSQAISIGLIVAGLCLLVWVLRRR
jgi:phosphatidylglycerol:prolipoprotein diacylglycerol transferase